MMGWRRTGAGNGRWMPGCHCADETTRHR
jgi:hypothetical protein